jgi:hypothetical protein
MHPRARKPYAARLIALMFGLLCTAAHANAVWIPFLWEFTYDYGLLIVVVSIVAEAIVYRMWFPIGWFWESGLPGAVDVSVHANVVSAVAGLVIVFLMRFNLHGNGLLLASVFLGFFAVSFLIEFPVVWLRVKPVPGCLRSRTMVAVLVANAVSYCLIGGLVFGKDEMARRDEAARDARRPAGEKACSVVNVEYGIVWGAAIQKCMNTLGTTQGCDAGTHGIPSQKQLERQLERKFARSVTIKNGVIAVQMDALGEDGQPLALTVRPPPLAADLMAPWEKSGSAVEACDRSEIDRAPHRSQTEREQLHKFACWIKLERPDYYGSWLRQIMACIQAQSSPIGCNAGEAGIDRAGAHQEQYYKSASIVDGALSVELTLRGDDGKRLTFEARPQKSGEGAWTWVRSGTVLDACKSDVEK